MRDIRMSIRIGAMYQGGGWKRRREQENETAAENNINNTATIKVGGHASTDTSQT